MSELQDVLRRNKELIFLVRHIKRNRLSRILLTYTLLKLMFFYRNNLAFSFLFIFLNFNIIKDSVILASGIQHTDSTIQYTTQCSSWQVDSLTPSPILSIPLPTSLLVTSSSFSIFKSLVYFSLFPFVYFVS